MLILKYILHIHTTDKGMSNTARHSDQYIWVSPVASLRIPTITYHFGKNTVKGNGVSDSKTCEEIKWPDKVIVGVIPAHQWPCHITSRPASGIQSIKLERKT